MVFMSMTDDPTPVQMIQQVGEALYGPRWIAPLARDLPNLATGATGVSVRHVQRWLRGERPTPAWILPALIDLLRAETERRRAATEKLATDLEAHHAR